MTVFFQHVGEAGGQRDFPKTIGTPKTGLIKFSFDEIGPYLSNLSVSELPELQNELEKASPDGFQIWGIPSGAKYVLRSLKNGDHLLLLEAAGQGGSFAYGGRIIAFPTSECFQLSEHLWGEAKFPLIVFMNGGLTNYPWPQFCELVGYKPNWNPAGQTYRITEERLAQSGCVDDEQIVETVVGRRFPIADTHSADLDAFEDPNEEFFSALEGRELLRQHIRRERSIKLVREFKKRLSNFSCSICGFDFEAVYGDVGRRFIEAHHTKPISQMDKVEEVNVNDLVAVCSNCHHMLHRTIPAIEPLDLKGRLAVALEKRSV
ncbi:HNH endonuclease [Tropicimonas sp. TH_r6]|uniref:HNH endonuclease n=1 Tax=Tropicimonas sp. TH_r6 TaxID=3082085 RepID=UPI0029559A1C|nr:HNH endonuclease [Tropicimonas sp. TH_r6]MDV7145965.1 HNH endonuclease [Tropicimonas sp. TH_r6]